VNALELTGRAASHVARNVELDAVMHLDAMTALLGMRRQARADGIELTAYSAFRSFERQLTIWNEKYRGERPLLDASGRPLDALALSPERRIAAILEWSALPGASRHHWGTDVDLIDRGAIPPGFRVELTPAEFAARGPFAKLAEWLERHAARWGFFRPFRGHESGVQAEPWHYSFAPIAEPARRRLTASVLRDALDAAPLLGKDLVLRELEPLHARFVVSIDMP
jgi:LAS superfamily LD-carboxypeptidase LdcB